MVRFVHFTHNTKDTGDTMEILASWGLGPWEHIALLLTAAFVAGALNAVAGGGSFLTLPALVFTGVPPVVANATGTVALLPGYMAGAWGFREDMRPPPGLSMRAVVVLALIGGSAGAALLLITPRTLSRMMPCLLRMAA
jgi:uncharacterized membrane protein YfcA